jgi:hypothetical protein
MKKSGGVNRGTALKISGAAMAAVVAEMVANQLPAEGSNVPINLWCESLVGRRRKSKFCGTTFSKIEIFIWDQGQTPNPAPPDVGSSSIIFDNRNATIGSGGGGHLKGFYAKDGPREGESSSSSHSMLSIVVVAS